VQVVIAEDAPLIRQGLERLLADAGFEVVAAVGDAIALRREVRLKRPHAALVDIRMPPTHTDEGLVAAQEIRDSQPDVGVLVLSQYLEPRYALRLLGDHPAGLGYLLKERVADVAILADALRRVSDGECVLDPTIVARLLAHRDDTLGTLSPRELDVLELMAEGRSNEAIAARLVLSPKTIETHVRNIFAKLDLRESPDDHRRVLAVLQFLRR